MVKKQIKRALISVYHKERLDLIIKKLHDEGVSFLSTGGTKTFIESQGIPCEAVEELTTYPSILGGRVKTLHLTSTLGHPNSNNFASNLCSSVKSMMWDTSPFVVLALI